jgi:hypothetical protein
VGSRPYPNGSSHEATTDTNETGYASDVCDYAVTSGPAKKSGTGQVSIFSSLLHTAEKFSNNIFFILWPKFRPKATSKKLSDKYREHSWTLYNGKAK